MSDRDKKFVFYCIIVAALIGMAALSLSGCEAGRIARDAAIYCSAHPDHC